jgi:hypothetical protein
VVITLQENEICDLCWYENDITTKIYEAIRDIGPPRGKNNMDKYVNAVGSVLGRYRRRCLRVDMGDDAMLFCRGCVLTLWEMT